MVKMDMKRMYRNVPIHPRNRPPLDMRSQGDAFADITLPFGL